MTRPERSTDIYIGTVLDSSERRFIRRSQIATSVHVIGTGKSGKTRLLETIAAQLIDADDCAVVVLDPHDGPYPEGGLYHWLKTRCYDRGHAHRLITIDPAEGRQHGYAPGLNPFAGDSAPLTLAGVAVEQLQTVNRNADPQPMLRLWGQNLFAPAIVGGLAYADVRHALNVSDPSYRIAFAQLLAATLPDVAADWEQLVRKEGKTPDAIELALGSTYRRLREYLSDTYIRAMLSSLQSTIDPDRVIAERQVVLCNLSPGALERLEDRRMLGLQIIDTFTRAAQRHRGRDPIPLYLIVDEFHYFLAEELLELLNSRKFLIHAVLAHQGMYQLDRNAGDRRLRDAVTTLCHARIVFGGLGAADAEFFAGETFDLDPMQVKHEHWGKRQTSDVVPLSSQSVTLSPTGDRTVTTTEGYAVHPGDEEDELRSIQFMPLEEQRYEHAKRMRRQPAQHALLDLRGTKPTYFRVRNVPKASMDMDQVVTRDAERLAGASWAAPIQAIAAESEQRDRAFRERTAFSASSAELIDTEQLPSEDQLKKELASKRTAVKPAAKRAARRKQ